MDHQPEPGTRTKSESVRLEAVVARVSTPIFHDPATEAVGLDGAEFTVGVERSDGSGHPPLASELADRLLDVDLDRTVGRGLAVAATTAVTTLIWSGDIRAAVGGGLAVVIFVTTWILGGRVTLSVGQGVVGYRSDMGWPRGVQEDDVQWDWRPHEAESDDAPDPTG